MFFPRFGNLPKFYLWETLLPPSCPSELGIWASGTTHSHPPVILGTHGVIRAKNRFLNRSKEKRFSRPTPRPETTGSYFGGPRRTRNHSKLEKCHVWPWNTPKGIKIRCATPDEKDLASESGVEEARNSFSRKTEGKTSSKRNLEGTSSTTQSHNYITKQPHKPTTLWSHRHKTLQMHNHTNTHWYNHTSTHRHSHTTIWTRDHITIKTHDDITTKPYNHNHIAA